MDSFRFRLLLFPAPLPRFPRPPHTMSTMASIPRSSNYLYVAAKGTGGRSLGFRQASNRRQLAEQLRRERLVPLRAWELPAWAGVAKEAKLGLKDQAELNSQLAQLLSRGVPLVEALDVVSQSVSAQAKPLVSRIRELVAGGSSFADACLSTNAFDRVTVAVYRAAERTGDLAGAARQLAKNARRQLSIAGKATTLLIYPAIVLSISLVMATFMVTFIVPMIGKAITDAGQKLPAITSFIMQVGLFLREYWIWAILALLLAISAVVFTRQMLGALIARLSRSTPLLRDVVLAQESARFFTVMAAMTRSGIPLADALGSAVGAIGHPALRKQLTTLQTKLIEGGLLRVLIDQVSALPLPTRRLLIAAERSGDLTDAFDTLAGDMAEEVDRRSTRLLAALEPLLIVVMFVIIGSLLLSIMIPLMQISKNIG